MKRNVSQEQRNLYNFVLLQVNYIHVNYGQKMHTYIFIGTDTEGLLLFGINKLNQFSLLLLLKLFMLTIIFHNTTHAGS
jgi:hypothetical protein